MAFWQSLSPLQWAVVCGLAYGAKLAISHVYSRVARPSLHEKVVWITGASSGIGEALAYELAGRGCVLILSSRNVKELERVREECIKRSPLPTPARKTTVLRVDVGDEKALQARCAEAHEVHGRLDVVVANAGISQRDVLKSCSIEVEKHLMQVNFFAPVVMMKALVDKLARQPSGAQFVVTSSVLGLMPNPTRTAYCSSKFAIHGWFESARMELMDDNISVTLVCPGAVRTNVSHNALVGSGDRYGKPDPMIEAGLPPEYVARQIMDAISWKKDRIVVSQFYYRLALFLSKHFPSAHKYLAHRRWRNAALSASKKD